MGWVRELERVELLVLGFGTRSKVLGSYWEQSQSNSSIILLVSVVSIGAVSSARCQGKSDRL